MCSKLALFILSSWRLAGLEAHDTGSWRCTMMELCKRVMSGSPPIHWGNGVVPFAAIPRISPTAARFGLSLLRRPRPRIIYVSPDLLRRSPARRGSGELEVDRYGDPALPRRSPGRQRA